MYVAVCEVCTKVAPLMTFLPHGWVGGSKVKGFGSGLQVLGFEARFLVRGFNLGY